LDDKRAKEPDFEIPLDSRMANVNMYSSLDKTLVLWESDLKGTHIYILQARASSSSVEWLTFLRGLMGFQRPSELQITIPEAKLNLRIADPFQVMQLEVESGSDNDEDLLESAASLEEAVAPMMVNKCLQMLKNNTAWAETVEAWKHNQRIGLAWKRYDRLEWIHGVQEKKMFGTLSMIQTHDLELRPKQHYPTLAQTRKGKLLTEPPPVEGFLIRLTSQTGKHQRLGRFFFKRLYFATFDQYLFFTRPGLAEPPSPPEKPQSDGRRNTQSLSDQIPIIYAVNPYPAENGQLKWASGSAKSIQTHDATATNEARRKMDLVKNCEGFINLCNVVKVRKVHREMNQVQVNLDASDSESDDGATDTDEGVTNNIDDSKTIELLLKNGLVVRLRAYDEETKKEWKKRLRALVKYWRWRHHQDIQLYHQVRDQNLKQLQVDEEGEAWVGQFARKWELSQTYASPELYNMCGISCCRTIHMSGPLYSKPRLHGNFTLSQCVLIPGTLLLYESALRARSGRVISAIHQAKTKEIDLSDCYIYTGLLTDGDLLYHNRTFDANSPGHHALPRMWPDDGWDNWDEDIMTCFVLWKPSAKSWFRKPIEGSTSRFRRVSALGKKGNRMVFRARSRAERDRWVAALTNELERSVSQDEVRIVERKKS